LRARAAIQKSQGLAVHLRGKDWKIRSVF
jgi:hypothetical protein